MTFLILAASLGIFSSSSDIGKAQTRGQAIYEGAPPSFRLIAPLGPQTTSQDLLHFVWKQADGDFTLTASIQLTAGWGAVLVRESLDPDAAYCSITVDAAGNSKLRYRPGKGVAASNFAVAWKSPRRIGLQRRGNEFSVMADDAAPRAKAAVNGPVIVSMSGPVYAGLGCGTALEETRGAAIFSDVKWAK